MTLTWPKPGTHIKFNDTDKDGRNIVTEGTVNGEPFNGDPDYPDMTTHIPVYIHETDKCMMVGAKNIITW